MPNNRGALWQSSYVPESLSVLDHPLAPRTKSALKTQTIINEVQSVDDFADFADPLGVHDTPKLEPIVLASNEKPKVSNSLTDGPLSNTLLENLSVDQKDEDPEFIGFKPWRDYRLQILDEFHSKDLLCLETSFLKTTTTKHVRKKRPNEQAASIGVFHDLAEEDYKRRLNELSRILHQLWEEERRLECIKLCREVSALLSSPQSPRFYPQKFVLVTDFLETFGRLVFDRLRSKANEERIKNGLDPLPSQFSTTDILEKTRITARNWFGKVSEINDVVQRIYVGACLMPCMKFMDNSAISDNLMRLCVLACSLQHPLTSAYARCYICRISMRLMPDNRAPHWKCINDWIQNFQQQPMVLLWPALEYVIQCVAYGAMTFDDLLPLWEYCKLQDKRPFMLKSMFNALPPLYLAEHSLAACKILTSSEHINCKEICSFGEALLNKSVTIFEQNRRIILKAVWKSIKTMTNLKSFLSCCEVWAEFAARYFGIDHVHFILDTVVERLTPERRFEQYLDVLASMASRIVRSVKNVAELVDAEVFPRFFQLFTDRDSACQLSTVILSGIVSKHPAAALNDTTLAYQIVDMCKCVHDVLNIHSASEKVASSEQLICRALDRFDLQEVPEQSLSFFVAARAALLSLDECQRYITGRILELSLFVVRSARFSSARSAFVQACVANAYITIPSLPDPSTRIQLFIQSAELALAGMAFLQVDSFLDVCQQELQVFLHGGKSDNHFVPLLSQFLAFLLTVPTFEDKNCLPIYNNLFDSIQSYEWPSLTNSDHVEALFACLRFLYTLQNLNSKSTANSQFLWSVNQSGSTIDVEPSLNALFERLSLAIQKEPDRNPLISIYFLETLSNFNGQIDKNARPIAKLAYKKCKNADQSIIDRMTALSFENSG